MAAKIRGLTIEISGDTTKFDKAIRAVDKNTKKLNKELKGVNTALKFNPTSVDLWRQKQTLLTSTISKTQTKLDILKKKQEKMDAKGVSKNSAEYRKLQREIIESESKLKHFQKELRKTGNAKLTALGNQFKQVGSKMTGAGKTMARNVTAPLTLIGGAAAKKFAEVDKIMQLTNSTMANTEAEALLLNKAMKSAAASSTYGMNDAANATLNFARAGLDAEQAASALAPAMALAAGEGGDLDTVSGGLVATINGFGDSFENAGTYADVFANACNNSALDVNSLSTSMSVAAPIFSAAGYEVKDAALYLGVMANKGIDANKAANSLKTGLARLVAPTDEGAAMMKKLGISVTNADGTMKDSVAIQQELSQSFGGLSESEQLAAASAIFGKQQMAPWLALINTAPKDVAKLNQKLGENGTALEMQAAMMSGFGGSIEQLKSGIDVLLTSLGEALAPIISKGIAVFQLLVNKFNELSPTAQRIIAVIMVIVAAIGPLLVVIGVIASSIGSIISLIGVIGPAIAGLAGPIGWVVAAIAAAIAIGIALYKNWDKIKKQVLKIWTAIKDGVSARVKALKSGVVAVFTALKNWLARAITAYVTIITAPYRKAYKAIKTIIKKIKEAAGKIKDALTDPFKKAYDYIAEKVQAIKDKIDALKEKLKINLPSFNTGGGERGAKDTNTGGRRSAPVLNMKPLADNIGWYKTGGIFTRATVAGLGEAGDEAVVPLDEFWKRLEGLAGGEINITVNITNTDGLDAEDIARKVTKDVIRRVKNKRLAWT